MKIKIKKLNENAKTPVKSKAGDFCYDVWATSCEEVAPNVYKYGIGLAFEIVRDNEIIEQYNKTSCSETKCIDLKNSPICLDIDFRPRSSVWKTGMVLCNCEGTIDEGDRNQVFAFFYHVMPNMPKYEVGDRIGQIKIGFTTPIEFEIVDELDMDTERGLSGFGSTGK